MQEIVGLAPCCQGFCVQNHVLSQQPEIYLGDPDSWNWSGPKNILILPWGRVGCRTMRDHGKSILNHPILPTSTLFLAPVSGSIGLGFWISYSVCWYHCRIMITFQTRSSCEKLLNDCRGASPGLSFLNPPPVSLNSTGVLYFSIIPIILNWCWKVHIHDLGIHLGGASAQNLCMDDLKFENHIWDNSGQEIDLRITLYLTIMVNIFFQTHSHWMFMYFMIAIVKSRTADVDNQLLPIIGVRSTILRFIDNL